MKAKPFLSLLRHGIPVAVVLLLSACGSRDIMDTPFERSSETAFQESYARFESRATPDQSQRVAAMGTSVSVLIFMQDQLPGEVVRELCRSYWPVDRTIWQTLGGHTPNEIIEFGNAVMQRMNQPSGR